MTDEGDDGPGPPGVAGTFEDADGPPPGVDRDEIADRIRDRAEEIRDREREVALRKLSVRGEVTERQEEALSEMAAGIVDGLLSTPEAALREADDETLLAAVRMYGVDPEAVRESD